MIIMARMCQVTKKRHSKGRNYQYRGIAKKKKGIGLNITGKSKRRFFPNIQKKRIWDADQGCFVTMKLSAHGLRVLEKKGVSATIAKLRLEGTNI